MTVTDLEKGKIKITLNDKEIIAIVAKFLRNGSSFATDM